MFCSYEFISHGAAYGGKTVREWGYLECRKCREEYGDDVFSKTVKNRIHWVKVFTPDRKKLLWSGTAVDAFFDAPD